MANIYIKLLKEFEPTGLSSRKSISPFMERHFKKPTSTDNDEWYRQNHEANLFLNDIKHTGHFDFEENEQFHIRFDYLTKTGRWYDIVNINARLTIAGLAYLNEYQTNDRLTKNSTSQTFAILLAGLLTAINLLFTLQNSTSSKQIDALQTHIQAQSQQLHTLQIELSKSMNQLFQEQEAKKTSPKKN